MTVRQRLFVSLAGIIVLLLVPALYGVRELAVLRDIARELRGRHAAAFLALGRLETALVELDRFQRSYVAAPDSELGEGTQAALLEARRQIGYLIEAGYAEPARVTQAKLDRLAAASSEIRELVAAGAVGEATALFEEVKPMLAEAQRTLPQIVLAIDRRSAADVIEAQRISSVATTTTLAATVIAVLLALALGWRTTTALASPLRELRSAVTRVAGGEFETPEDLPYEQPDEIGDLARSFRAMTERLTELERTRAEFVSLATHELKTPVNVIVGYTELLQEGIYGTVPAKQKEVLATLKEQTQVLTRLVNQLLDVSRIEAGGFRIEREEVMLADLFTAIERSFQPLAKQKRIDFRVEADASVPPALWADGNRLRNEVMGNLLSNAFKFTPPEGRVQVHAWSEADGLHIEVRDTGVGIPADQLPHIFEKYYQVGQQARAAGTGLGLAIARDVVESHGGTIRVESAEGRGTAFHILLPAPAAQPGAAATRRPRNQRAHRRTA